MREPLRDTERLRHIREAYKAVMEAIRKIEYSNAAVNSILVTARGLSEQNRRLAEALSNV